MRSFSAENAPENIRNLLHHVTSRNFKQSLLPARDVISSCEICGSKLERVVHIQVTDAGCPWEYSGIAFGVSEYSSGTQKGVLLWGGSVKATKAMKR